MSALPQNLSPGPDAPQLHGDESVNAPPSVDAGGASALQDQHADIGSLIRAALLNDMEQGQAVGLEGDTTAAPSGAGDHIYDGHVPLALDSDFLPAIDATLDLLTTSTDLFDVPVADFGSSGGSADA